VSRFDHRVAVTSRSFSKNEVLKGQLLNHFPNSYFNEAGSSLSGESLIDFLAKADCALTALEKIDGLVLSRTPHLRAISKIGVGTDMIDFNALEQYGVRFLHYPGTN
jgi:phosphoglycerate dehydrogenase-like enzyme